MLAVARIHCRDLNSGEMHPLWRVEVAFRNICGGFCRLVAKIIAVIKQSNKCLNKELGGMNKTTGTEFLNVPVYLKS